MDTSSFPTNPPRFSKDSLGGFERIQGLASFPHRFPRFVGAERPRRGRLPSQRADQNQPQDTTFPIFRKYYSLFSPCAHRGAPNKALTLTVPDRRRRSRAQADERARRRAETHAISRGEARRYRRLAGLGMVGARGIEPLTPSMSRKCSTAELSARRGCAARVAV